MIGLGFARRKPAGRLKGRISNPARQPIITAKMLIGHNDSGYAVYPDAFDDFTVHLPSGAYDLRTEDIGRETISRNVKIKSSQGSVSNRDPIEQNPGAISDRVRPAATPGSKPSLLGRRCVRRPIRSTATIFARTSDTLGFNLPIKGLARISRQ